MRWVAWVMFGMMTGALFILGATQEGQATGTSAPYHSTRPELPVMFEYPADWEVEESSGSQEVYSQVQIYGPRSLEPRLRTYLVVRSTPPKAEGGKYATVEEMVKGYRATLQPGLQIDAEQTIEVLNRPATQLEVTGTMRLPWKSPRAKLIPVKSQRVFFEQDGRFYEFAWMSTPEVSAQVAAAFSHLLETFALVQ